MRVSSGREGRERESVGFIWERKVDGESARERECMECRLSSNAINGTGARGCMRAREKSERRAGEGERE
jgi:hypothetical protein